MLPAENRIGENWSTEKIHAIVMSDAADGNDLHIPFLFPFLPESQHAHTCVPSSSGILSLPVEELNLSGAPYCLFAVALRIHVSLCWSTTTHNDLCRFLMMFTNLSTTF